MRTIKSIAVPLIICFCAGGIFLGSCQNLNEEDLFGETGCDTLSVSYSEDIAPILSGRCLHCHYTGAGAIAPFSLETYQDVLIRVNTGQLDGAVNHRSGYPQMPRDGPKLPECELTRINIWIREGAPNN